MADKLNKSPQKERKKVKMRTRMSIPILLVVLFQLLTSSAVLIFGGEFRDLKEYSYNTLVEKTENRSTYIRNKLQEKPVIVQGYAERINSVVAENLKERNASIADLQTDKELNYSIIESSVDIVSNLLQHAMVDEAYLILETGDLYADEGSDNAKAALYLRDMDPNSVGDDDLLMELGFSSISQSSNLTRSSGWSQFFTPNPADRSNFDFYYKTLQTAQDNSDLPQNHLGYWSRFSKASSADTSSLKYSLPLIAQDGTVYGILGIGLTESTVLSDIPSYDFLSETACYVLGYSDSDKSFDILLHSGFSYGTLLENADTLHIRSKEEESIYNFDTVTDINLSGSVQYMELYDKNSPYAKEQWALISVADRSSVLRPLLFLQRMLVISALLSLVVAAIVAVLSCTGIIKPISNASKLMKIKRKYNEVIRFQPSNIYEIDEMTDAITQLQINVHEFSSQVSKMIRIADVGMGTFMYDRSDDSVFVGQGLINVLSLGLPQGEDIVVSRQEFLDSIRNPEIRSPIAAGLEMTGDEVREDFSEIYQINQINDGTFWMRLGYTYSPNTAIGIVQDITDTMIEKNQIEYERDYDNLTGLLTRHSYHRRIKKLFHDRSRLNITAFVMIDLDNLKYVNDTYGHDFGDDYIKTAAAALKKFQDYGGIVSRISGDEFNICLPGFSSKEEVREIIASVRAELLQGRCLLADGTHFKISASIGISWYPDDADSYELLMKYADFAMYTVKHSTKGETAEFDMNSYLADSVLLTGVEEMERIIEERSVKYAFQSIISVKTGEIYGYEALMHVQSEIFQSPLELLRIAKTSAKLYEIERLTLTKSLADFQAQIDAGRIEKTSHIFINSIANNKFASEVEAVLEKKYPHLLNQIVIEIMESESSNEDYSAHKAQLLQKKWGAQLALDNFGTGRNSESALLNLQPDIVKISHTIINGCDKDASRRVLINNLVKLARTKNVLVLAEGVETEEEMKTVISCGVDFLQGYYFSYPLFEPKPIDPEITNTIRGLANQNSTSENTFIVP